MTEDAVDAEFVSLNAISKVPHAGQIQRKIRFNAEFLKKLLPSDDLETHNFVEKNIKMKDGRLDYENGQVPTSVPTRCYGRIDFQETTTKDLPLFIRCTDDTDPETLFKLFTDHWNVEEPGVLISFTGGALPFDLDPRVKKDFLEGFSAIATKLNAWVISGGTSTGIMRLVGEAFYGTTNVCIGISSWGVLANRDSLTPAEEGRGGEMFPYPLASMLSLRGELTLDSNHTHFVFVDDGSEGMFGREIRLRGEFEHYIIGPRKIPSILLVMEGGPHTIDTVYEALRRNILCVVFKGSGRAADVLAYALENVVEILKTEEGGNEHAGLFDLMNFLSQSPGFNKERISKYKSIVIESIKMKELFIIADVKAGYSTEEAILTALLNSLNFASTFERLMFAVCWDVPPQLADDRILKGMYIERILKGTRQRDNSDANTELQQLLIAALALNRVAFVKLLNGYGISMSSLLTRGVLEFLYGFRLNMENSTMQHELEFHVVEETSIHQDVFERLIQYKHKSRSNGRVTAVSLDKIDHLLNGLLSLESSNYQDNTMFPSTNTCSSTDPLQHPFHHLFIWSLLNNMLGMSLLLWQFQEDAMAHAIIAAEISGALVQRAQTKHLQSETSQMLATLQTTYHQLSLDLLHECYKSDESNTKPLIAKPLRHCTHSQQAESRINDHPLYRIMQGHSCLSRSVESKDDEFAKNFASHQSAQDILDEVWAGSITRRNIQGYQVLLYIFFPFLLYMEDIQPEKVSNITSMSKGKPTPVGSRKELSFPWKLYYFYFHSPVVRFYLHTIGYVLFLMLFAYIAMLKKISTMPSSFEILLIVTVFGYTVNEFAQVLLRDEPTMRFKFRGYIANIWNKLDVVCILCFLVGLVCRCVESTLQIGHLFYAFDVMLWILRALNILYIHPVIGPWVLMIGQMLYDLSHFLSILFVFLLSYGIAVKAILDPTPDVFQMFVATIFRPYFHIHGEYFLDKPDNTNTTWFGTTVHNSYAEPISFILLGVYLLLANVLLLNLVIAIFNSTYENILGSAVQLWRYQKYEIVLEYTYRRSVLFSPFSLIIHFGQLVRWLCRRMCIMCKGVGERKACTDLARQFSNLQGEKLQQLRELEGSCLIKLMRRREDAERVAVRIEDLSEDIEQQEHATGVHFQELKEVNKQCEKKLNAVESRLEQYEEKQMKINDENTALLRELKEFFLQKKDAEATAETDETMPGENAKDAETVKTELPKE